jgi:hypothetical protein
VVSISKILPNPDEVEKVRKAKQQAIAKAKAEEEAAAAAAAAAAEAHVMDEDGPPSSRSDGSQTKSHRSHGPHSSRSLGAASSRSRSGAAAVPGGVRLGPVEDLFEALGGVAFLDAKIRAMQFR